MTQLPKRTNIRANFLLRSFLLCAFACLLQAVAAPAADIAGPLRLTLPPTVNAVVGQEMGIFFDNIVLTETPEKYRFSVACDLGKTGKQAWRVVPQQKEVGEHKLSISVADAAGKVIGCASATLRVAPADSGKEKAIRLLIVGDSLTHATLYPNELGRLLSKPGNPQWTMLGTHRVGRANEGVLHEGYGGWTWRRFVSAYEPNPDGTYRKRSSPFVFLGDHEKPVLDLDRYWKEACGGHRPDFVIFLLGINDCFGANPEKIEAIDVRIDAMFEQANRLLAAFKKSAPQAELAVCLTPPPNARESGFEANYHGKYHRWGWKRIQHRLIERQIKQFSSQESKHRFAVPTELYLDPSAGYPVNNGVHPNEAGYRQLAASMYAWLKVRLDAK